MLKSLITDIDDDSLKKRGKYRVLHACQSGDIYFLRQCVLYYVMYERDVMYEASNVERTCRCTSNFLQL